MGPEFIGKPWSWAKLVSILEHSWIPVFIIGAGGTAGMIRKMRANLLDELQKQYVVTARAKGLPPGKVLRKYPLRMALNFFISDIGSLLPHIISGAEITAVVLSLPTTGPDAPRRAQEPGHVPRRLVPDVPRVHDRRRRPDLRPGAGGARPAHPVAGRGRTMNSVATGALAEVGDAPGHVVSTAPFDPTSAVRLTAEQEHFYLASQWTLMWWKFKRHRVAVVSGIVLLLMYGSCLVTEILVPYNLHSRHADFIYAPPQDVHWMHDGKFVGPFVYPLVKKLNMETLKREYSEDKARPYPLRFFCSGDSYEFWGLFEASFHLVCPPEGATSVSLGDGPSRPGRHVADLLRRANLADHRSPGHLPSASRSASSSAASPAISAACPT